MATQIKLADRLSHSFKLSGTEFKFEKDRPKVTTNQAVIDYCKAMPRGMFAVTDGVELPKSTPVQSEPLEQGDVEKAPEVEKTAEEDPGDTTVDAESESEPDPDPKPRTRKGGRKKVKA